jgi:hypothetical protein
MGVQFPSQLLKLNIMNKSKSILSIILLGLQDKLIEASEIRRYENAILNIKAASIAIAISVGLFIILI